MKTCSACNTPKELTEFFKDKYSRTGHHSQCKQCKMIYQKRRNSGKWWEKDYKITGPMSYEEIARALGTSRFQVKIAAESAMRKLAKNAAHLRIFLLESPKIGYTSTDWSKL